MIMSILSAKLDYHNATGLMPVVVTVDEHDVDKGTHEQRTIALRIPACECQGITDILENYVTCVLSAHNVNEDQ